MDEKVMIIAITVILEVSAIAGCRSLPTTINKVAALVRTFIELADTSCI